jgi:hypothetical protein
LSVHANSTSVATQHLAPLDGATIKKAGEPAIDACTVTRGDVAGFEMRAWTLLDRMTSIFAPVAATRRVRARAALRRHEGLEPRSDQRPEPPRYLGADGKGEESLFFWSRPPR